MLTFATEMLRRINKLVWMGWCAMFIACTAMAQDLPPKREFRAMWVCTLANLDWPSRSGLSSKTQQDEYREMLEMSRNMGLNALIVQIRPSGDALYPSELVPWTQYLSGKQGQPPSPYYDPLAFMVEESRRRNIEFHAWFNPFRALSSVKFSSISPDNPLMHHPNWFFTYGDSKYFDPGIPDVRDYLVKVVMEVVHNYDIDGIHLDDYFYPYPLEGQPIPDNASFQRYGQGFKSREAWRRANIDAFISQLADSIFITKPWVKFGISPFGVWRGQAEDDRGSATTRTFTAYDGLYADTRKWIEYGWVDYMAPQLYWNISHSRASFKVLLDWWDQLATDRHVYAGHGVYMMQQDDAPNWANSSEYMQQVRLCRTSGNVCGNVWFRANTLKDNPGGIRDVLDKQAYAYPALVPTMPWIDSVAPLRPRMLLCTPDRGGISVDWDAPGPASDGDTPAYYLIYRFRDDTPQNLDDPRFILAIRREGTYYRDEAVEPGHRYTYVITSVDRLHNESTRFVHQTVTMPVF
jgi:uncharacterized lipoprotein YddW (UPF0748 family)